MSSDWPNGIITPDLDRLESLLGEPEGDKFLEFSKSMEKTSFSQEQHDYLSLLDLERILVLGDPAEFKKVEYESFLMRRSDSPRAMLTYVRVLIACNQVKEARALFSSYPKEFFPADDCAFVESLFCLREQNEIGWLNATKEALKLNPTHRGAVTSISAQELRLPFQIGALSHLQHYLTEEPLDIPIRSYYAKILRKTGLTQLADEEDLILSFLKPDEISPTPFHHGAST
jgi:hypothetical protein